jgi:putative ABC transport system ATP-binding protein
VLEALESINRRLRTTVAIITHNAAIGAMADRVIHLHDGRIDRIERNPRREQPSTLSW